MIRMDTYETEDATLGYMVMPDGEILDTIERKWADNQRNISCIPAGQYRIKRDRTGRHQWFSVQDVPNRTFIELHEGSLPRHSDGCILLSRKSLETLVEWFGDKDWILDIRRDL